MNAQAIVAKNLLARASGPTLRLRRTWAKLRQLLYFSEDSNSLTQAVETHGTFRQILATHA